MGGTLAPGSLISESELSKILKMGRTPIREAIARLRFIGFVDVHSRKGISVSGVDIIRHLEVLEVRQPLEETVVLHAIERATESDMTELTSVSRHLSQIAKSADRIAYFRTKRALHESPRTCEVYEFSCPAPCGRKWVVALFWRCERIGPPAGGGVSYPTAPSSLCLLRLRGDPHGGDFA